MAADKKGIFNSCDILTSHHAVAYRMPRNVCTDCVTSKTTVDMCNPIMLLMIDIAYWSMRFLFKVAAQIVFCHAQTLFYEFTIEKFSCWACGRFLYVSTNKWIVLKTDNAIVVCEAKNIAINDFQTR